MREIEPEMVLGKEAVDGDGLRIGEIVDVGLYNHSRVKFLVVQDRAQRVPIRRVAVDAIDAVSADVVTLRVA